MSSSKGEYHVGTGNVGGAGSNHADREPRAGAQGQQRIFPDAGEGTEFLAIAARRSAKQYTDLMQRNVGATFDLCDKLIQAKDQQDAMRIQSEFFQAQVRAVTDQARSMGESAIKAMTGAFTPRGSTDTGLHCSVG